MSALSQGFITVPNKQLIQIGFSILESKLGCPLRKCDFVALGPKRNLASEETV
jgi:hypothetical protein